MDDFRDVHVGSVSLRDQALASSLTQARSHWQEESTACEPVKLLALFAPVAVFSIAITQICLTHRAKSSHDLWNMEVQL